MKKNIRTEKKRSDDQTAVILEDLGRQFMAFGEGQSLLIDRVDDFKKDTKNQFTILIRKQSLMIKKLDRMCKKYERF